MTATPTDALRLVPIRATPQQLEAAAFNLSAEIGADEAMKLGPHIELAYELLVAAAPASPLPGGGWQDISTAPKDGTPILITRPTSYPAEEAYHVVRWEEVDGFWFCHDGKSDTWLRGPDPTHWMPLPAAPTGAK